MRVFLSINMSVNVELVKIRTIFELTGGKSTSDPANIRSIVCSSIFVSSHADSKTMPNNSIFVKIHFSTFLQNMMVNDFFSDYISDSTLEMLQQLLKVISYVMCFVYWGTLYIVAFRYKWYSLTYVNVLDALLAHKPQNIRSWFVIILVVMKR